MSEKMTAAQAKTFEDGFSIANATILELAAQERGCDCEPYVDWFTYKRWQAQGFQVQKGEKSSRLPRYITVDKVQTDGTTKPVSIMKRSCVFCRCQVKAIE